MYCIIYSFEVKAGKQEVFEKGWAQLTEGFRTHCQSLGSRLHRVTDTSYFAYAQWPNPELFQEAQLPEAFNEISSRMKEALAHSSILTQGHSHIDKLA